MEPQNIIGRDDLILVTGASGFIGRKVVTELNSRGFRNMRCFVRPSSDCEAVKGLTCAPSKGARIEIVRGNLLSIEDCTKAVRNVAVIYHLAAGRGEKFFSDAFMNSVVTTRNLLEAVRRSPSLKRFVSISSFSVYSNCKKSGGQLLDESSPIEKHPHLRGDAYTFAKAKQDAVVEDYGKQFELPYVIVRPGVVYGPGNEAITGRTGTAVFGLFLHLGGKNKIPFTYVDNCAQAIVLAGLKPGVDGEVFNVVDNELPSSAEFLRLYKKHVRRFNSIFIPHWVSYLLCWLWEEYVRWSKGQVPLTFNRRVWHAYWKRTMYSNKKAREMLGWTPSVSSAEGLKRHFASCRKTLQRS